MSFFDLANSEPPARDAPTYFETVARRTRSRVLSPAQIESEVQRANVATYGRAAQKHMRKLASVSDEAWNNIASIHTTKTSDETPTLVLASGVRILQCPRQYAKDEGCMISLPMPAFFYEYLHALYSRCTMPPFGLQLLVAKTPDGAAWYLLETSTAEYKDAYAWRVLSDGVVSGVTIRPDQYEDSCTSSNLLQTLQSQK